MEQLGDRVARALRALGGEATRGDLVAVTGLAGAEVDRGIEALLARDGGHVRVFDHGDLTYFLVDTAQEGPHGTERASRVRTRAERGTPAQARRTIFDRRTLRLIRARQGVISLAELVEQTGLPLREAAAEMRRLADAWGGEAHAGLDGHSVYAFPDLMSSVHGRFAAGEPRPAWVRADDPMDHGRVRDRRARLGAVTLGVGVASVAALPLLGAAGLGPGAVVAVGVAMGALAATGLQEVLRHHRRFRFRQPDTLRRYAFGHVVQTALAGKGVVSLERTVSLIQARAGKHQVSRAAVESALRALAADFDAPITTYGADTFFGFRNVKRQFLASHLLRRELALGHTVTGDPVFDSSDPPEVASARELEAFDRALYAGWRSDQQGERLAP